VLGASELFLALAGYGLPPRRKLAGHALAAALALFLTLLLASLRGQSLTADVLAFLLAVIVVALVGSFIPAVLEAVAGSLLLHSFAIAQPGTFTAGRISNAAVLGVFVAVAVVVSFGVEDAARRTRQAARRQGRPDPSRRPTGRERRCSPRSAMTCAHRSPRRRRR